METAEFVPKRHGGHVFIIQGFVSEVACDGFWVTTDVDLSLDAAWMEVLGEKFVSTLPPVPEAWKQQTQRVLAVPPRNPDSSNWREKQWAFLVNFKGLAQDSKKHADPLEAVLELYEQVILEFVGAVVELIGSKGVSLFGRPKKLIGIPLAGTSSGSLSPLKNHVGRAIQKILPLLQASADKYDMDFILGTGSGKPKYAAVQTARARHNKGNEFTDFLSPALLRHGKRLAKLASRGDLALFIGAGVSVGCGLPLWKDLLHNLAVDATMTPKEVAEIDTMNSLDAAKIIEQRFPDRAYMVSQIARNLRADHYAITHSLLAALPCREVITTNYDTSFERATWDTGTQKLAVIPYYPRIDCERWLLKMHGCVTSPSDIVLTREDYIRYSEKNQALAGIVQSILIQKHMLFIGFSLVDDNFHKIMDAVRRTHKAKHDLDDPKTREHIACAYAGMSEKQNKLAERLKFDGEPESSGTILSLYPHPLMDAYWREMFDLLNMTSTELTETNKLDLIRDSVRILEIFLDYIALEVSKLTTVDNLLLPYFENTLDADERLARYSILNFVESFPKAGLKTIAWEKIRDLLLRMGGNEIVKQKEAILKASKSNSFMLTNEGFDSTSATDSMSQAVLKQDHFEHIHRLENPAVVIPGAPNFRKVPGFPVFGCGQPAFESMTRIMAHIRDVHGFEKVKWFMLRQEPVIYINGMPYTPRRRQNLNANMEFPNVTSAELATLQEDLVRAVRDRMSSNNNTVWFFRDSYGEHPDDRQNREQSVQTLGPGGVLTTVAMTELCRAMGFDVEFERYPIADETAPSPPHFDGFVRTILSSHRDSALLLSCQMGKGRTTSAIVIACLIHRALGTAQTKDVANAPKHTRSEDSHLNGNFKCVEELLEKHPTALAAKIELDEIIDLCGPPFGLQNIREVIWWTKGKHDAADTKRKGFWLQMGQNFMHRYLVLIIFSMYVQQEGPDTFKTSFVNWLNRSQDLEDFCYNLFDWFEWQ